MNTGAVCSIICLALMALAEACAWKANAAQEHKKYESGKGKNTVLVTIFSFLSMAALFAVTLAVE